MKAVLVIGMPTMCDECKLHFKDIDDSGWFHSGCCAMGKAYDDGNKIQEWCPLRPLPTKKQEEKRWYSEDYSIGWNDCLDAIEGDANKEKHDADIIKRWERYCSCGEKMMPNTAGGWYCPVCHRTMNSILFKRVK